MNKRETEYVGSLEKNLKESNRLCVVYREDEFKLNEEIQRLKKEIELLEEANDYYANKSNWEEVYFEAPGSDDGGDVNMQIEIGDVEIEDNCYAFAGLKARSTKQKLLELRGIK